MQQLPLQSMLTHLPGMAFFKNNDLIYCAASKYASNLCGFNDVHHFCGRSDYELRCAARESADLFRDEDMRVMREKKTITCLQIHQYADTNVHIFILQKAPVFDNTGKVIGICANGDEITNPSIGRILYQLLTFNHHDTANKNLNGEIGVDVLCQLLSIRESELLFYFMRGFTNKEIGAYMSISARTVETYLDRIKCKLKCTSRNELQSYCMQHGLMYIIPKNILKTFLNKSIQWAL